MTHRPPYAISSGILLRVEKIGEALGRIAATSAKELVLDLRRQNRIKTIQASLQIEGNTLSLEQVTAVLDGKRVLGLPREIQEVKNAFDAYESMDRFSPGSCDDLLAAHLLLMRGLVEEAGRFRTSEVGILKGQDVAHVAPPAKYVSKHMENLLDWLDKTDEHPLVASCVFHYELEFIHPFQDGNGRMGRFWQTLILSKWRDIFALLPVESIIRDRQSDYYRVLGEADQSGEATGFVAFMLDAILQTIEDCHAETDQDSDQASDQVKKLLHLLKGGAKSAAELMADLGLSHRPSFRKNYLHPAMNAGLVEMTIPGSPNAKNQKYRLSGKLKI